MALLDGGRPHRDILPPINHPDFEKSRSEHNETSRFSAMPGLSISTAPFGSPTTVYSGPPPPYSCASSTTESAHGMSGYFSPPYSATRRSTRDDKDFSLTKTLPSLPPLHEALGGDKPMSFSGPPSATQPNAPGSIAANAAAQSFPDAPRGPPNPFSHTAPPSLSQADYLPPRPVAGTSTGPDPTTHLAQPYSSSPRVNTNNNTHRSSASSFSSVTRPAEHYNPNPSYSVDPNNQGTSLRDHLPQPPVVQATSQPPSQPPTSFNFEPAGKFDDSRNPFRSNPPIPYGETVKRHLDVFDAEMALSEITDISNRTFDFSRSWAQRSHASNRSSYFAESAPSVTDIDEMIRQQHRLLDNLNRIREVVVVQQNALSEQRARAARNPADDEFSGLHEEYKTGGFAGGDAKKRRGKAAPPGRCHSCNRAETPEWRRGPDGARTLCNACGLHYAKLTRKLGANKTSGLTGSSLRPKGLDPRPSHV